MALLSIGTLKIIAKAIEHKFPGSCTDIIESLDEVTHNPAYIRYRIKELQDKWDEYKESFSSQEMQELSDNVNVDISDPNQWESVTSGYATIGDAAANLDTDDIIPEVDTDIIDSIVSFINGIFD